jgi:hypothetical protein
VQNARLIEPKPARARRIEARHPWVWIRHDDEWRKGAIHCWYVHDDTWMAWMQHDPADPDAPWAVWGLYAYDRVTIRRRHHPAAVARVEVPASWGPSQVIQTRLRNLGYAVALIKTGGEADELRLG